MRFRRFAALSSLLIACLGVTSPATAQTCPLLILCPPKTLPAPPPSPVPPPPPSAVVPTTDQVTEPVTGALESAKGTVKTPVAVLEAQMLNLINADRAAAGLRALQVSGWAQSFARTFSEKMMAAGTIWHNPEYFAKGRAAMGADLLSENVGYDSSIPANHIGFMRSPSHRANILDGRLTHVGIGVAVSPGGRVYVTEDFARIPGAAARDENRRGSGQATGQTPTKPLELEVAKAGSGQLGTEVETIRLAATAEAGQGARPLPSQPAEATGAQSPAPMIPGVAVGGAIAMLAPILFIAMKLLLPAGT